MEEDLLLDDNQIVDEDTDFLTPDEDEEEAEETTETETELSEGEQTEETQSVESVDFGDLEVKYLHDTKKLKDFTPEEVKTYIQKGMNHDRISEKLKANEGILENFNEIANFYGYDLNTLTEALYEQFYHFKADKEGKTPNEVRLEHQLERTNKGKVSVDKQTQAFERLLDSYDVKADSIKPETWARFNEGVDLKTAYELQLKDDRLNELESRLSQMQNELKVKTQNENAKKKSVVKPTTTNGIGEIDDDYLAKIIGG